MCFQYGLLLPSVPKRLLRQREKALSPAGGPGGHLSEIELVVLQFVNLVGAKSAPLCLRLTAKNRCAPLRLLSGPGPLRWALCRGALRAHPQK